MYDTIGSKIEVAGGTNENNYIQNMAMYLGNIADIPRIDYIHKAF